MLFIASGTVSPVAIAEGFVGGGVAGRWLLSEHLAVTAGVHLLGLAHAWRFDDGVSADFGTAFDVGAACPATISYDLTDSIALTLGVTGGATTHDRIHQISGQIVWERSQLFAEISGGLTFNLGDREFAQEKSVSPARGGSDG